jgi:catechol 2,3-dioxygenase-like lactoylglutathione lyase family enzyme
LLNRIVLYVRDVQQSAQFYAQHFGFVRLDGDPGDRITELRHPHGGASLMLHKAGRAQKMGQVLVKLVFDVEHVAAFVAARAASGLHFGSLHQADGYDFANAKDPDGNSISVSSRAYRSG